MRAIGLSALERRVPGSVPGSGPQTKKTGAMASNEASKKVDLARGAPRGPASVTQARQIPPVRVPHKRVGPGEFIAQVRDEARKVTWPSRKETTITTIMVFVMVILASLFFTVVDQAMRFVVGLVLGL